MLSKLGSADSNYGWAILHDFLPFSIAVILFQDAF
jgi:hypothetical protein